jgi:hypothetical protein
LLGIVGAFVATYLGQAIGWYRADEGAGFVGAAVGAVILLAIYHFVKRPQLSNAHGDAATKLPEGVPRPTHWPAAGDQPTPD